MLITFSTDSLTGVTFTQNYITLYNKTYIFKYLNLLSNWPNWQLLKTEAGKNQPNKNSFCYTLPVGHVWFIFHKLNVNGEPWFFC